MKKYGKWALVTGASAGIGEAYCFELAKLGYSIVLVARRAEKMKAIASKIEKLFSVETLVISVNLADEGFLDKIIAKTKDLEIGILVSNAGFGKGGKFIELDQSKMSEMVKLNCVAPTILVHHFAKEMAKRKCGAIIHLASVVAYQAVPYYAVYSATKAFNLIFGESLWYELKENGIDSLVVSPGSTKSEFRQVAEIPENPNGMEAEEVVKISLKKLGKRSSIATGFINKLPEFFSRILPRRFWIKIVADRSKENVGLDN